jgi:dolichol-phosphate mannosyltransferase
MPTSLSIVVPAYNEALSLPALHAKLVDVTKGLVESVELIIVDDGSSDETVEVAQALPVDALAVRVVSLARNFGHQTAITAGIDLSVGDAVVIMDADLQHPPEAIPEMVALWRTGAEVVYGVRSQDDAESAFKRVSASLFYRALDGMTDINVPANAADFRLLDRSVVNALRSMREDDRYLRGMIAWLGFNQQQVLFDRPARFAGTSKYSFRRMVRLAKDGMVGFSNRPLTVATNLGFAFSFLAIIAGVFGVTQKLAGANLVPGWASVLVLVSFIGGIQLMVLGVFGEYLGRVHAQVRQRPLYVVRELSGFERPVEAVGRAVLPEAPPHHERRPTNA